MGFPAKWMTAPGGSGNLDTVASGVTTGGTGISTANVQHGTLSCHFALDAETDTFTMTAKFQVSADGSTWYDLAGDAQNPANVVLATGTAGADAVVNRVIPVPPAAMGWKLVRPAIVAGGTTGAAVDTYAMTWYFRGFNGF